MFQRQSFGRNNDTADWKKVAVILTAAAVLLAVGLILSNRLADSPIKKDTYQLVRLTTGEVYFGKLQNIDDDYVILKRVYTQAENQPATEGQNQDNQQNGVVLNRLSVSIAKPEDTMYIASDKIVHWENLQKDSKIVQAIENDNK